MEDKRERNSEQALRAWVTGTHRWHRKAIRQRAGVGVEGGLQPGPPVSAIETSGRATCETLIRLARAAEEPPLPVLVLAGWLTEAEAGADQMALTEDEAIIF